MCLYMYEWMYTRICVCAWIMTICVYSLVPAARRSENTRDQVLDTVV